MKKLLVLCLVVLFLGGGTAWAGQDPSDSTGSHSPRHSRQKHSKKKKSKKKKKGRKKKGSKGGDKSEVKMETGIGKSDVTLDLKDK
ncbi:MAG TPA: hypothetical protein VK859_01400 [bacterium]|nr:hypothetical protein [bacterium]